jgi:hypothetical protein
MSDLKQVLERVISSNLTPENVSSLLVAADQLSAQRLLSACKSYILKNKAIVSETPEYVELKDIVQSILDK